MDTLNSVNECEKAAYVVVFHQQSTNQPRLSSSINNQQITRVTLRKDLRTLWRHYDRGIG